MKSSSSLLGGESRTLRYLLISAGVLVIGSVVLTTAPLVAPVSPLFGLVLAWTWIVLPGALLSKILIREISWMERIPVSFVLGMGLATVYMLFAILLRLKLHHVLGLSAVLFFITVSIYLLLSIRRRDVTSTHVKASPLANRKRVDRGFFPLTLIVVLLAVWLTFQASQWPAAGDDLAALPHFAEAIYQGGITGSEPFHGSGTPLTPRNELIVWGYLDILSIQISNIPLDTFFSNFRPILILLALSALFTFLHYIENC